VSLHPTPLRSTLRRPSDLFPSPVYAAPGGSALVDEATLCKLSTLMFTSLPEDAYSGRCAVASGALPPWLRGTLFRAGPGLWEVGDRQLRHSSDGFGVMGTVNFNGTGEVFARQQFVDNEPYRAARRGQLIVDKFASRRRFEGWGAWAQDRIRVRRCIPSTGSISASFYSFSVPTFPSVISSASVTFCLTTSGWCFVVLNSRFPFTMSQAVTGSKFFEQAGHGRLVPIRDGADVKMIAYNPSAPGVYSVFDPDTLTSISSALPFNDALKIDYASNSPVLDADGVSYNGARLCVFIAKGLESDTTRSIW